MERVAVDEKKRGVRVNERNLFLYPHKCHVCGKRFEARPEYVFKIGQYKKKPCGSVRGNAYRSTGRRE